MDSPDRTLDNLRSIVGCNGLRDFNDLGKMRLDTLHSRIRAVNYRLSRCNVISMCIIWLQNKALQAPFSTLPIKAWCTSLLDQRCNKKDVLDFWKDSLKNIWLYHQRCDQGPTTLMNKLYGEIKRHFYRDQSSPDKKQTDSSNSYPQDAFLGKAMDSHWEPPPPEGGVAKHFVAAVGCAEKTIKPGRTPSDSRDGVSRHQTAKLSLDKTGLLSKQMDELRGLAMKHCQEKETHEGAAQREGTQKNLEVSKAPSGLSLAKPLAKDVCRRCHTAGHAISNCPTINDSSWDPPPHPRYICAICGVSGSHYVWDCEWHRPNTQASTAYGERNQYATESNAQVAPPGSAHPAEVMRGCFPTKSTLPEHSDDLFLSANTKPRKLALRSRVPDSLNCGPQSRPRVSIESETSSQRSIPRHQVGRLSPWEEEKCDSLDEGGDVRETVDSEAGEVAGHTADDFLSRFGIALKRHFNTNVPPEDLICLGNEPTAKKLRIDVEDGEVLDGSHLPSLVTRGTPTPGATNKDEGFILWQQLGGPSESAESTISAAGLGRSPSVYDLFPNREWEHTTHEARQTAMELWQNDSENSELATGAENEAPLLAIKLEESHSAIDHSIAIEDNENDVAAGRIAEGEEHDTIPSITSLSGSSKEGEECDSVGHVAACELHHSSAAIYSDNVEVKQGGDTTDPLVAAQDNKSDAAVGAVEENAERSASATDTPVADQEDQRRSSIGHAIADGLRQSDVAVQPAEIETKQDRSGDEDCEHTAALC